MKAHITPNGCLVIVPENETEAFALSQINFSRHPLCLITEFPVSNPLEASPEQFQFLERTK